MLINMDYIYNLNDVKICNSQLFKIYKTNPIFLYYEYLQRLKIIMFQLN